MQKDFHAMESMLPVCYEYLLLGLDLLTAYRYLLKAETDWDYRFFARRIYTLMHETQPVLGRQKDTIEELKGLLPYDFTEFDKARNEFFRYIQDYSSTVFKPTRNTVEAHRDESIVNQLNIVHNMSVKESGAILLKGFEALTNYSDKLMTLLDKLIMEAGRMTFISYQDDERGTVVLRV